MSACLFVCADSGKMGVGSRKSAKIGEMVPVCVGTEAKKMYRKGKQICEYKHISMCKTHKIRRKICCRTDGDVACSRWADRRDGQSGGGIAWGRAEGACAMMGAVGAEWATLSDGVLSVSVGVGRRRSSDGWRVVHQTGHRTVCRRSVDAGKIKERILLHTN